MILKGLSGRSLKFLKIVLLLRCRNELAKFRQMAIKPIFVENFIFSTAYFFILTLKLIF